MRSACTSQQDPRDQRAGGAGPALLRVLDDSGGGDVSDEVPPLRIPRGEGAPVAEQSALQQTIRGSRGSGLRERFCTTSRAAIRLGRKHGAGDRFAVLGALGGQASKAAAAAEDRKS